jgi:thioredoxin 1
MVFTRTYPASEPARSEVDTLPGPAVIEFGTAWCGHCVGAQPLIEAALATHTDARHIKVEDGPGRPLGRSYRIKLWPTLVFLRDGEELARVVRPAGIDEIRQALALIDPPGSPATAT